MSSVREPSASPIWPSSPAVSPAPNSMKTAIPLALAESSTEPASESAESTATAAASISAGATVRSGHQSLNAHVITVAARKTTIT